jgi:hypothetical protein
MPIGVSNRFEGLYVGECAQDAGRQKIVGAGHLYVAQGARRPATGRRVFPARVCSFAYLPREIARRRFPAAAAGIPVATAGIVRKRAGAIRPNHGARRSRAVLCGAKCKAPRG